MNFIRSVKMKSIRFFSLLLVAVFTLPGCVTLFSPAKQSVNVYSGDRDAKLSADGKAFSTGTGKVKLRKKEGVVQLEAKKEGYITQKSIVSTEKRSPLRYLNIALSPLIIGIWGGMIDNGTKKKFCYPKSAEIPAPVKTPKRSSEEKFLYINQVAVNLSKQDTLFVDYASMRDYRKNKQRKRKLGFLKEEIKLDNSIFQSELTDLLGSYDYVDTLQKIFPNPGNTLYLNSEVKSVKFHWVEPYASYYNTASVFVRAEVDVEWQVLDYYQRKLFTVRKRAKSGEFAIKGHSDNLEKAVRSRIFESLVDALNYSLVGLLDENTVKQHLKIKPSVARPVYAKLQIAQPSSDENAKLNELIKSSVTVKTPDGHGSGFFISKDGYVITNLHVVANQEKAVELILHDGSKVKAELVRQSDTHDLALLKTKLSTEIKPLGIFTGKESDIGEEVWAIGTPKDISLGQTVSKGIISGLRTNNDTKYLQTDVSINSGNSGGALVAKNGEVQGIVTAKIFGAGVEGISFAIPTQYIFSDLNIEYIK